MSVCVSSDRDGFRFVLIVASYPLGASSVLLNLVTMLTRRGVHVDIFTDSASLEVPYSPPSGAVRLFVEPRHFSYKLCNKFRLWCGKLFQKKSTAAGVAGISGGYFRFGNWVSGILAEHPYDVVMYVNYSSLFVSSFLRTKSAPSIYYNLELLDDSLGFYGGMDWARVRGMERKHLRHVDWVFATSPRRGECFQKLTGYAADRIHVLPVLPMTGDIPPPSRYFREKFSLPENAKIVICAGSIGERMLQKELINTVRHWPDDTVLVFHSWQEGIFDHGYGLSLQEAAKGLPVYFSAESLDYKDISSAIASASVGLAFYDDLDSNTVEILFSSNKIIEYLRCGVPVITCYNTDLDAFFVRNRCGFAVRPEGVPEAVAAILRDHGAYRQAALNASRGEYSFEHFFDAAFEGILPQGVCRENMLMQGKNG